MMRKWFCLCSALFREEYTPFSWWIWSTTRPRPSRQECWLHPPAVRNLRTFCPDCCCCASAVWIGTHPKAILFSDQPLEPCTTFMISAKTFNVLFFIFKHVLLIDRITAPPTESSEPPCPECCYNGGGTRGHVREAGLDFFVCKGGESEFFLRKVLFTMETALNSRTGI